jgi:hypothetical protein
MRIELQYFSNEGKREDRTMEFEADQPLTLFALLNQIAENNPDVDFGRNGYVMDHFLCLDGNRIIHPKDDVSRCEKIVIVPFVDGG